jgi:thiol-disulfide isomerase/thioredoxin
MIMTLTLVTPFQANLRTCFGQLDAAYRASMDAATEHLRRSGMAMRAKGQGDRAPDFALSTRDGARIVLSDLLSRGPVVLSFFRGEWCSFCRLEMDALLEACPAIVRRGLLDVNSRSSVAISSSFRLRAVSRTKRKLQSQRTHPAVLASFPKLTERLRRNRREMPWATQIQ